MNKEELRRLVKKKVFVGIILGFMLGAIITGVFLGNAVYNQRIQKEASMELLMFTINVSNYCAEYNNMTYQELLDRYVMHLVNNLMLEKEYKTLNEWAEWDMKDWEQINFPNKTNNVPLVEDEA